MDEYGLVDFLLFIEERTRRGRWELKIVFPKPIEGRVTTRIHQVHELGMCGKLHVEFKLEEVLR